MKNPWTKKNPFMSMWLSGANSAVNSARGQAAAAGKREAGKLASAAWTTGTRQVLDFWSGGSKAPAAAPVAAPARKPRKARKSR